MTKSDLYEATTLNRTMIRLDITRQMLKGTVIAGAAVFGPILFVVALAYAGMLLPEESKEAADPTPDSFGTPD